MIHMIHDVWYIYIYYMYIYYMSHCIWYDLCHMVHATWYDFYDMIWIISIPVPPILAPPLNLDKLIAIEVAIPKSVGAVHRWTDEASKRPRPTAPDKKRWRCSVTMASLRGVQSLVTCCWMISERLLKPWALIWEILYCNILYVILYYLLKPWLWEKETNQPFYKYFQL